MPDRPIVEAVAGELEPVEAEVEDEESLELPGGLLRHPTPAEVGVHRQPADARDAVRVADELELHRPRALAVELDDHRPGQLRLLERTLDLHAHGLAIAERLAGEEGLRLLPVQQVDDPVDVVEARAAKPDHGSRDPG